LVALYLAMWPLTAPVPVPDGSLFAVIAYIAGGVFVAVVVCTARIEAPDPAMLTAMPASEAQREREKCDQLRRQLRGWKIVLTGLILTFDAMIPALYYQTDAERFPILALVLILIISTTWAMGGIAFFADRYRVPVLTALVVLTVIPRALHWDAGREEHYLSTAQGPANLKLPTPREILLKRQSPNSDDPLIIVTSTGGGIHAAAWTTAVLGQLENTFKEGDSDPFSDHLLLLSTVSGGSSGLYTYLRELKAAREKHKPDWNGMRIAAGCSSLEAVGWGIVYNDIPRAFFPGVRELALPSSGTGDLLTSPIGKDRTWALRRAFARNLNDPFCKLESNATGMIKPQDLITAEAANQEDETDLTLTKLRADDGSFPAFSMNTTSVEYGERFLLANYRIPDGENPEPGLDFKARSFLTTFGQRSPKFDPTPDLPLATAAQMSATFPYVSSQARVPTSLDSAPNSVHFADGGYYDNDGTVTAIEFLRYALAEQKTAAGAEQGHPQNTKNKLAAPKVRILLIEIRNSDDIQASSGDRDPDQPVGSDGEPEKAWNLFSQLIGPLEGFWNAGHETGTPRDQAALELLEEAYGDRLELHPIVFGDTNSKLFTRTKTDPLNWSLTPAQQDEVVQSSETTEMKKRYAQAKQWFDAKACEWDDAASAEVPHPNADCKAH
jgi:hypothetical protein